MSRFKTFTGSDFLYFFFFFSSRRRHTRLQGDWSSDVCSSDLGRWFIQVAIKGQLPEPDHAFGLDHPAHLREHRAWVLELHQDLPCCVLAEERRPHLARTGCCLANK